MKILAWNCWGLARGPTTRALRDLIRTHRSNLLFLFETKVPSIRYQSLLFGLGFASWLEVPPVGLKGGLFMTWRVGVDIEPVHLDDHCISCLLYSDLLNCPWLLL